MKKGFEKFQEMFVGQWVTVKSPLSFVRVFHKCVEVIEEGDLVIFKMQNNEKFTLEILETEATLCTGVSKGVSYTIELATNAHPSWIESASLRDSILTAFDIKECTDPETVAEQKARASRIKWQIRLHHMVGSDSMAVRLNKALGVNLLNSNTIHALEQNKYIISDKIMAAYEKCDYPLQ